MSIIKLIKTWFCFCWMPLYFGGDTSSKTEQTTNNFDNRSVVTNTLDGGAIPGIVQIAGQAIKVSGDNTAHAYDYADNIFHSALDFANKNDSRALNAYDRAAAITSDALVATKQAYQGSTAQLQSAYADAKGTTGAQQQIIMAVLAVAGVFAFASMHRA